MDPRLPQQSSEVETKTGENPRYQHPPRPAKSPQIDAQSEQKHSCDPKTAKTAKTLRFEPSETKRGSPPPIHLSERPGAHLYWVTGSRRRFGFVLVDVEQLAACRRSRTFVDQVLQVESDR